MGVMSAEQILDIYLERKKNLEPMHSAMRRVKEIYDGTARVPLPDMDDDAAPSVPNLLAQGVDQMAGRVASTTPMVGFASDVTRRSTRRARTAERVVGGWWQNDRLPQKMKHRARHLIAYGMSPCVIRLDKRTRLPVWHTRNPLETFPSPGVIPGTSTPENVVFAYRRTRSWLEANGYGMWVNALIDVRDQDHVGDCQFLVLEYVDPDCTCLTLASPLPDGDPPVGAYRPKSRSVIIEYVPNPTGVMNAVIPQRIGLEKASGQFDAMVGMYYQQAKLMALEVMAVERGIFPDTYVVSRPGEIGKFIDGPHDGRSGLVNIIAGGDIKEMATAPGYMTPQTIDRIERSQRLTAGIPAEFGGESGSNIRTGRRGDAVLSAVIDFPVAEAQEVFAFALTDENKAAIALSKHYAGGTERTLFVGTGNTARKVTYKPNDVFDTLEHTVSYSAVGADLNNLMLGLGQRVGMGIMSKETAAHLDPFIDSPEAEHDSIISEGIETALLTGIQQLASQGQIPPLTLAKVMKLVKNDQLELAEALNKAVEDAQKEARKAAEEQRAGATPDMAAAEPTAAALSGNPEALSPVPGAEQGIRDVGALLGALRGANRAV
jgi:hypothetical protein